MDAFLVGVAPFPDRALCPERGVYSPRWKLRIDRDRDGHGQRIDDRGRDRVHGIRRRQRIHIHDDRRLDFHGDIVDGWRRARALRRLHRGRRLPNRRCRLPRRHGVRSNVQSSGPGVPGHRRRNAVVRVRSLPAAVRHRRRLPGRNGLRRASLQSRVARAESRAEPAISCARLALSVDRRSRLDSRRATLGPVPPESLADDAGSAIRKTGNWVVVRSPRRPSAAALRKAVGSHSVVP